MVTSRDFWDKVAEKYAASPIKNMDAYEQTLARTRTHLGVGDKVLEVGCGTGTTALKLAGDAGHITASDISTKMVEIGRGKAAAEGVSNIDFVQGTLEDGSLPQGPFDAVLAFNFLHLVEDLPGTLRDIHTRLKSGGHFISKTVCLGGQGFHFPIMIGVMRFFGKAPYVAILKTGELEDMIRDAGFDIVEAEGIPEGKPNHFVVARKR